MSVEARLKELGLTLPAAPKPAGAYVPAMQAGDMLYIAGQVPMRDGSIMGTGRCGDTVSVEAAAEMARQCALNALAIAQAHLGSLDRVKQTVRVAGYVASTEAFAQHPKVVNGASELLLEVLGDAGRHARIAVGVASLPAGVPVEVEFSFQVTE